MDYSSITYVLSTALGIVASIMVILEIRAVRQERHEKSKENQNKL